MEQQQRTTRTTLTTTTTSSSSSHLPQTPSGENRGPWGVEHLHPATPGVMSCFAMPHTRTHTHTRTPRVLNKVLNPDPKQRNTKHTPKAFFATPSSAQTLRYHFKIHRSSPTHVRHCHEKERQIRPKLPEFGPMSNNKHMNDDFGRAKNPSPRNSLYEHLPMKSIVGHQKHMLSPHGVKQHPRGGSSCQGVSLGMGPLWVFFRDNSGGDNSLCSSQCALLHLRLRVDPAPPKACVKIFRPARANKHPY